MPCLVGCIALATPRLAIVLVVLFSNYIGRAYDTILWPFLGFLCMPLTTLAYAWAINTSGSVKGINLVVVVVAASRRAPQIEMPRLELPDSITPFTVLGLLRKIERNNGFDGNGKQELATCINRLEQHFFFRIDDDEPDLEEIAANWIRRSH